MLFHLNIQLKDIDLGAHVAINHSAAHYDEGFVYHSTAGLVWTIYEQFIDHVAYVTYKKIRETDPMNENFYLNNSFKEIIKSGTLPP